MALPLLALAGGGIISSLIGAKSTRDASKRASQFTPVDINAVDAQARAFARRNAIESDALERELNPETANLRDFSLRSLYNNLDTSEFAGAGDMRGRVMQDFRENAAPGRTMSGIDPALLRRTEVGRFDNRMIDAGVDMGLAGDAMNAARRELALGGQLSPEIQNLVARRGAATAGRVGSMGLGRDITARDLGLTGQDLLNQRIGNASNIGTSFAGLQNSIRSTDDALLSSYLNRILAQAQAEEGMTAGAFGRQVGAGQMEDALTGTDFARRQQVVGNRLGTFGSLANEQLNRQNSEAQRRAAVAALTQSIQKPLVGLDPSSVANISMANVTGQNSANQQGAAIQAGAGNSLMNLGGQMAGFGLGNYFANQNMGGGNTGTFTPGINPNASMMNFGGQSPTNPFGTPVTGAFGNTSVFLRPPGGG